MAKTYNNIWQDVIGFDALHSAYLRARKGRRESYGVMLFESDLEGNLIQLQNELIWGSYQMSGYYSFYVFEPKKRKITALREFRDRVVQQAVFFAIEPVWERRFIYDSYACRVGKGTHLAANKAQSMLKECLLKHGMVHALKADISKFFASLDHLVLKTLIRKRLVEPQLLSLLDQIIESYSEPLSDGVGQPIGNLTSQLFANIYMDELDQWMKSRRQERWYVRYMDDFVVIHPDKKHLHDLLSDCQLFLFSHLKLRTNNKTQVFPVAVANGRGLDFVGYHLWPHKRRLRRSSVSRMSRSVRALAKSYSKGLVGFPEVKSRIVSYSNHAKHGGADRALQKILNKVAFKKESL